MITVAIDMHVYQANSGSSQKGEEKIKERCRQVMEAVRRRETALITDLRRLTTERQSAIDAELDRVRYNIVRFVSNILLIHERSPERNLLEQSSSSSSRVAVGQPTRPQD